VCRTQKRELGLAMMLLCVVTIFFLCNVLALIVNILEVGSNILKGDEEHLDGRL
jgi:hypothetical protein